MEVKEAIISALNVLGRSGLAEALSAGSALDDEGRETVNALLYCFNAVEDELARNYVPLTATEELSSPNGKFFFKDFSRPPVRIKRARADGKDVKYKVFPQYLAADAYKITVEYDYVPPKKNLDGASDYGAEVSERLFALGMASEYCLINGELEASGLWERKYREQIDGVQSVLPSCGNIPPRRWI